MGLLIHGSFSIVNTIKTNLAESTDAEPQIWRKFKYKGLIISYTLISNCTPNPLVIQGSTPTTYLLCGVELQVESVPSFLVTLFLTLFLNNFHNSIHLQDVQRLEPSATGIIPVTL